MVTIDQYSDLVADIYESALAPDLWRSTLQRIQSALDGSTCGLLQPNGIHLTATLPDEASISYAAYYRHLDYVIDEVSRGESGVVRCAAELFEPEAHREFHTDWATRYGCDDGLFVRMAAGAESMYFIVGAQRRNAPFESAERVGLVRNLVVHLERSLRIQAGLAGLTAESSSLLDALAVLRHGVLLVDGDGVIRATNPVADRMLSCGDVLTVRNGRVTAVRPIIDTKLRMAIAGASMPAGVRRATSLTCPRPGTAPDVVVQVVPLSDDRAAMYGDRTRTMLVVHDRGDQPTPSMSLLRNLYGLTASEARVAVRVAAGVSLRELSDELCVSYETVRTHLQHVFSKTQTHRQGELVSLLKALAS